MNILARIKLAAQRDVASLYGVPQLVDDVRDGLTPGSLQADPSPEMEAQRWSDGVRRAFDMNAKVDSAGSSNSSVLKVGQLA